MIFYRFHMNGNLEWCWLNGPDAKGYKTCTKDSDCESVINNSCHGSCSVG